MKFKGSWIVSILPLAFNIIADIISEHKTKSDIEAMVKEEVERTLRDNGYTKIEKANS